VSQSGSGHHRVQRLLHEHAGDGVRAEGCGHLSDRVSGYRADRGLAVCPDVRAARAAARGEGGGKGARERTGAVLQGGREPARTYRRPLHLDGHE
jgi:hypothetical protein